MNDRDDIEDLAGEYVLGSLTDSERADVRSRISGGDARLAAAVAAWGRRLGPLSLQAPAVPPPARTLEGILASIAQASAHRQEAASNVVVLQRQVRRWRTISGALAASLVAVAIAIAALWLASDRMLRRDGVAILTNPGAGSSADEPLHTSEPLFLARVRGGGKTVEIRQLGGRRAPAGRAYVAWMTGPDGSDARRLGTLSRRSAITTLPMPANFKPASQQLELAVSLEAEAAVAGNRPVGPLISVGRLESD